jgi:chromate transporter
LTAEDAHCKHKPDHVSLGNALVYWTKLGFVSFGGPAGQISLMHQELVEKRRWISEQRFLHALNYTMVLPGPEAQQLATYLGWLMHGVPGGIAAGLLFVLPSLFLLTGLSWVYLAYGDVTLVQGLLYGIKPAVTAIVLASAYRIGARALTNGVLRVIALLAFLSIFVLDLPFPLIVLGAGAAGWLGSRIAPAAFRTVTGHAGTRASYGPALIDDDTPVPAHLNFSRRRFAAIALTGISLWAGMLAALTSVFGWDATLTQMGWFFTKAALVTFGGAYAVLPYVYQGGVEHYAWLSAAQMMDGLALGETTPGPLIMVVAFVGFVGGWTKEIFGPAMLPLAGIAGACCATFFTFLPSFLLILLGAPFVETSRHTIGFTAPLTAVTAAVVGVILNLALFFAYHVLWPAGFTARFEWWAGVIGILAFTALFKFKVGVVPVIGAAAILGLGRLL